MSSETKIVPHTYSCAKHIWTIQGVGNLWERETVPNVSLISGPHDIETAQSLGLIFTLHLFFTPDVFFFIFEPCL